MIHVVVLHQIFVDFHLGLVLSVGVDVQHDHEGENYNDCRNKDGQPVDPQQVRPKQGDLYLLKGIVHARQFQLFEAIVDGDELAYGDLLGQFACDFQRDVFKYEVDDVVDEEE